MTWLNFDYDLPDGALSDCGNPQVASVTVEVEAELEPGERECWDYPSYGPAWLCWLKGLVAAYDADGVACALSEADRARVVDWLDEHWSDIEPLVEAHLFEKAK